MKSNVFHQPVWKWLLLGTAVLAVAAWVILFAILGAVRHAQRSAVAQYAASQVEVAMNVFYTDYGIYPDLGTRGADTFVAHGNAALMAILRGHESKPTPQNIHKVVYFSYKDARSRLQPADGFAQSGDLLDPWGKPYKGIYDSSYDGQVHLNGIPYKQSAIVWSTGPDGVDSADDVVSFQ